jgi:serine/threonine protein kinase
MPPMSDKHWHEVAPSAYAHEREALQYLRAKLPDHEPWRVWTNFMFTADDGSMNEVDALVLSPVGLFLVEIKSHPGAVRGSQDTLYFDGGGFKKHIDHPRRLTNTKAKRLKSLLEKKARLKRNSLPVPRVEELVFLSHALESHLSGPEAAHVTFRDESVPAAGVIGTLTKREGAQLEGRREVRLDKLIAKFVTGLLEDADIVRRPTKVRIGDYQITARLEDGASFNDFLGYHTSLPEVPHRVRRFWVPRGTDEERERFFAGARREYRLLSRLEHPGILRVRGMPVDESGPALVFDHDPSWVRLDRYLQEHGDRLDLTARLSLLRAIAEPLAYAHEQGVVHRALSPRAILVVPASEGGSAGVKLMNWSTGSLAVDGTSVGATLMRGTLHVEDYQGESDLVFLAPELRRDPGARGWGLDVFSVGALGFQIFSGLPPASDQDDLAERVRDHGLDLAAAVDATPAPLSKLIARATHADANRRFGSVQDFLEALDGVVDELERPETEVDDPREAQKGSTFRDGTRVINRLGSGATAIAFLVERDEGDTTETYVLKVAREVDKNERLAREAAVLRELDHQHVARYAGDYELGAYQGFLTKPASKETLRSRLRRETSLQLELLERFGDQLLDALCYLEARGINHRDLKPDNIAISDLDRKAPLSLVLFDFSLSDEPLENIEIGTPQYADPFLGERRPKRWDLQAERFSAAVTLYEMAAGVLPRWGDGKSDPALTDCELRLDGDKLPSGLRTELLAFYERALARDPRKRFDNAEAMRTAWGQVFDAAEQAPQPQASKGTSPDSSPYYEAVQALGKKTPLHDLSFSTRARTALDRMSLFTVEALLAAPPNAVFSQRGVGQKTREELEGALRDLRRFFPEVEIGGSAKSGDAPKASEVSENSDAAHLAAAQGQPELLHAHEAAPYGGREDEDARSDGASILKEKLDAPDQPMTRGERDVSAVAPPANEASKDPGNAPLLPARNHAEIELDAGTSTLPRDVDRVLARLRVGQGRNKARSLEILDDLLGLRDNLDTALSFPAQTRTAEKFQLNAGWISQELARFRVKWVADEALESVREDLARFLERSGGLATPRELAEALLAERGSLARTQDEQQQLAAALARMATEAEAARKEPGDSAQPGPRWTLRRREGLAWLAASDDLVQWGTRLVQRARQLAAADPLLGRDAVEAALLEVPRPAGTEAVQPARLARLVASAARDEIDLSARGELYPVPLPADRALSLSLGALTGAGSRHPHARRDPRFAGARVIEPDEIQERVQSRYPRSEPLPNRPELDRLLSTVGWAGRWDDKVEAYVLTSGDVPSVQSVEGSSFRTRTTRTPAPAMAPEVTEAQRFATELEGVLTNGRFCVVKAPLGGLERAVERIQRMGHPIERIDLDARLIESLDAVLAERGVDPERFYTADAAGPSDPAGWSRVLRIVDDALARLQPGLLAGDTPLLIQNVGLLARYDRLGLLEALNGLAGGTSNRGAIVLVPGEITEPTFALFGRAIPALQPQYRATPRSWLEGRHLQAS